MPRCGACGDARKALGNAARSFSRGNFTAAGKQLGQFARSTGQALGSGRIAQMNAKRDQQRSMTRKPR